MTIKYDTILQFINKVAIQCAYDGNPLTGYQMIEKKRLLFIDKQEYKVSVILLLKEELQIDLEIITGGKVQNIVNFKEDIEI